MVVFVTIFLMFVTGRYTLEKGKEKQKMGIIVLSYGGR